MLFSYLKNATLDVSSQLNISERGFVGLVDRTGGSLVAAVRDGRGGDEVDPGDEDDGSDDLHNARWSPERFQRCPGCFYT